MPDLRDPVLQRIIWDRLIAVADEEAAALIRTAFTPIVRDAEDLSAGVFDHRGRMLAQSLTGTPGHINSMATSMEHFLRSCPPETLRPGDVLVTNDPWHASGHLNDLTVATPVFRGRRLVGFFASTCHAIDIGGRPLSADARDVFEEGLRLPVMKLYRRGRPNEDLFRLLEANVRSPIPVFGDLHAQVSANVVGGRRLVEMLDEFGLDDLGAIGTILIELAEAAMRQAIRTLPPGTYSSEVWADGYDEPIRIRAQVTVGDGDLIVDYTGTSPESRRGINVVLNYTVAYTNFAVKAAVSPEVPNNVGSFRPVAVVAPPGCILNAQPPAPVAARAILGHFVPGAIFQALQPVIGERALAGGADAIWLVTILGRRPSGGEFTHTFFSMGGMGARAVKDGLSATGFPSGVASTPVEVTESLVPVVVHRRELRTDSGGAGTYRGGLAQTLEMGARTLGPFGISVTADRTRFPAPGAAGGHAGALASITDNRGEVLQLKSTQWPDPTTIVRMELPGGGGFGEPRRRDPRLVLRDVVNGHVSLEAARTHYGVVIRRSVPDDELVVLESDFELDETATQALRRAWEESL